MMMPAAPPKRCAALLRTIAALDGLNRAAKILVGLLLAVATVSVAWQILVRMALDALGINIAAPWTEEIARYAMIWAVFIGVGVISRHAGLIAVEMLPQFLPAPAGKAVKLLAIVATTTFFVFLAWIGGHFALDGLIETSPVLRLPMAAIYAALPTGATLSALNLIALTLEALLFDRNVIASDLDATAD